MSFCGPDRSLLDGVEDGATVTECFADFLLLLAHILLLVVAVPNLIFRWMRLRSPCDATNARNWVTYPGHCVRWLLTLLLLAFQILEVVEGGISESMFQGLHLHLYVPHCIGIIATVFTLVYYTFAETYNLPRYLLILLLYWSGATAMKALKLVVLIEKGLGIEQMRVILTGAVLVVTLTLVLLDMYVLIDQRYVFFKSSHRLTPPEELAHVTYVQNYVNLLSKVTWHWLSPILVRGYRKTIDIEDLGKLPSTEHASNNFKKFHKAFETEMKQCAESSREFSLWRVLARSFLPVWMLGGLCKVSSDLLLFVGPMVLDGIVGYVTDVKLEDHGNATLPQVEQYVSPSDFIKNGYALAVIALMCNLIQATFWQNHFYISVRQGIRVRAAIQAMVFDKTLRLSTFNMNDGRMTQGQIMNHMAVDPFHVLWFCYWGHFSWSLPLQIVLTFVLLYVQLGWSALISGCLILIMIPIQFKLGACLTAAGENILKFSDDRLKRVNELISSIKLLKLYAWEFIFCGKVEETRKKELRHLFKAAMLRSLSVCITDGAPIAAALITFTLYPTIEKKPLPAGKVFSGLALFNILTIPLVVATMVINFLTHAKVSIDRLKPFYMAHEVEKASVCNQEQNKAAEEDDSAMLDTAVSLRDSSYSWDLESKEPTLHDLDLDIPKGKLTMIVGQVGSGKSSLLSALLGEMTTLKGKLKWDRSLKIAYAAQKAWLMNATLKENVVFAEEADEERYKKIKECCALQQDIEMLPGGDQTEIGEKGINMSGGQKQRVSVARAMYSQADVVILDDPLSALDVHVGGHIFREGIMRFLLRNNRTVILVTHQLQYLNQADKIVAMKDGRIHVQGTLAEIKQKDPEMYASWNSAIKETRDEMKKYQKESDDTTLENARHVSPVTSTPMVKGHAKDEEELVLPTSPLRGSQEVLDIGLRGSRYSLLAISRMTIFSEDDVPLARHLSQDQALDGAHNDVNHHETDKLISKGESDVVAVTFKGLSRTDESEDQPDTGKLIEEEEKEVGAVKFKIYARYARAATLPFFFFSLFMYIVRQGIRTFTDFWLAEWTSAASVYEATSHHVRANQTVAEFDQHHYMVVYGILVALTILTGLFTISSMEMMCLKAARTLHHLMLRCVVRSPTRFFDTTPIGRILNRFAGDTNIVDEKMSTTLDTFFYCALSVLAGLAVNAVTSPYFLIPTVPMFIVYLMVQRFYIASCREMQRLDSVTKSPVLAQFNETLGGLQTIRAYRDQERFKKVNLQKVDVNTTAFLYLHTANVWMGVRLDYLGAFVVFASAIASISSAVYGSATPGLVGLSITYALQVSTWLNWVMRNVSEAEMWFNAVERVEDYTQLKSEPYHKSNECTPDSQWPGKGEVEFKNVSLRYDEKLPNVVHSITLTIQQGEKIGICGRTGSGKSSTTLGLFRIIDISEGKINIDGVDISLVPLSVLRSKLSIIPQDPVLFTGTVRHNLDPDNKRTDEDIWTALDIAQLKGVIRELGSGLDAGVAEGGENFSVGQRQLFCLARAFLRNSRILIMDEATASIDMHTDAIIQKVIREVFKDKTVITIAHRVATILHFDKILVLGDGQILEHDSPQNLLSRDSVFSSMVRDHK